MSKSLIALAVAVLSVAALASYVSAAPAGLGTMRPAIAADAAAMQVHWRGYRHCRHGSVEGRCHGKRRFFRDAGPSVQLYIGPGRRHHHRRWKKHHD